MQFVSVIICSHNPRADYLRRVLGALKAQTLPKEQWELLLVDNLSDVALEDVWELSWHPQARHIREAQLGLTHARLRGFRESKADILVLVDDDNVLSCDYLEEVVRIEKEWPILGVWGGPVVPEFDTPPDKWTRPYWRWLGIRNVERDKWSNMYDWETVPCGAGMCARRHIAENYIQKAATDPLHIRLGRKGTMLTGGEDIDLAFTACDLGYGTGQFKSLCLTHLIPPSRLELLYLIQLAESIGYSGVILEALRGKKARPTLLGRMRRIARASLNSSIERRLQFARMRGERSAANSLREEQS
jgi:glycosyltransferase involved in cell wall biosynthesis